MIDTTLFKTLKERGLLYQCTDEEALQKKLESGEPIVVYEGTDPTADSLHLGHCIPYCIMRRFQQAGHKVILLMGGATACIGDPSGRNTIRKMLDKQEIANNIASIKSSLSKFLDFEGENPAIVVNNADWYNGYDYIDFMREIGVHFNVNEMLATEIYNNRLEAGGLTFFELGYMLMQAYDFIHLADKYNCTLQYGGGDQWANVAAGVKLARKLNFNTGTKYDLIGATNPLLVMPNGKKMGKTEKGAIWIDNDKISAYDFYQGIYQTPDACVRMMFALFTDIPMPEIDAMIEKDIVNAKKVLSYEITKFIRGEQDAILAQQASENLFNGGSNLDNAPTLELTNQDATLPISDILVMAKLCASKGEARRLIDQGGISLNDNKVCDFKYVLTNEDFSNGYALLKKGKKQFIKLVIV
ncbi:MAG: tyrosine--tRNA ligase [Clostridiales bacterium]|nr:tyrosine--tRNA ligase [Clostridiales bacterium]